jgi:hypothetical protein
MMKTNEAPQTLNQIAVARAISWLQSAGARYQIKTSEGKEFSNVPVGTKRTPRANFRQTGYIERVRAMKPGETLELAAPEGIPVQRWGDAVRGAVRRSIGYDKCAICVSPETRSVQVLRCE